MWKYLEATEGQRQSLVQELPKKRMTFFLYKILLFRTASQVEPVTMHLLTSSKTPYLLSMRRSLIVLSMTSMCQPSAAGACSSSSFSDDSEL